VYNLLWVKSDFKGKNTFSSRVVILKLYHLKVGEVHIHTSSVIEEKKVIHIAFSFFSRVQIGKLDKGLPDFQFIEDEDLL